MSNFIRPQIMEATFLSTGTGLLRSFIQYGELDVIVESSSHTLHPGDCILINANIIHSTKCTVPNKAIVLQIPLDFMEKYIPNVQQLVFFWDYQTKDPVKKTEKFCVAERYMI